MKKSIPLIMGFFISGCSTEPYTNVAKKVDLARFMGSWYVQAGRFTYFEKNPYNSVETYTWNETEKRIDVDFRYNMGALNGPQKSIPQKGWVEDRVNNSTWKVSPFWPLKFGYLILALSDDYQWTAVGVPDQSYLWIMSRDPHFSKEKTQAILADLKDAGYNVENIQYVEHQK
jgi:apolipoprotein D and lipocalin family protein